MKNKFFSFIFLIFVICSNVLNATTERIINYDNLERKNRVAYVGGEDKPFTGIAKTYYENNQLFIELPFKDGLEDGILRTYYENGTLQSEEEFKDGLRNGFSKIYYENGKLESEYFYVNDTLNGLAKIYYENGQVAAEGKFENDVLEGISNQYYEDGTLKVKAFYKNGKLDGEYIEYDRNGLESFKTKYSDGVEQKSIISYFKENGIFIFIATVALLIPFSLIKIFKALPSFKMLDDYQKKLVLKKLLEFNNGNTSLYSSYRLNGVGTGFYKIKSFEADGEKITIFAKMFSLIFIPMPFVCGYIVCYDKDKIVSSISTEDFKVLKREIEEEILYR